ncbi:NAD(P)-binding protein, partial [Mesorhizobium sp. M1A.F.Ca.IN.022.07.1.1]
MEAEISSDWTGEPAILEGAIVIGAGAAGLAAAYALIEAGIATEILEREG